MKNYAMNRRHALKLTGAAAFAGAAVAPAFAAPVSSWIPDEEREAALRAAMREFRVPGVGLAIVEDGALAWEGAYGEANIETQASITNQTLFQAASLTKPFFAYVVVKLVDEGRLSMDDRLVDFYRPHDLSASEWNKAITVRHVLTHQTGLPNWRAGDDEEATLEPKFAPGDGYSYSGEAFHWLQQVCETITGLSLHQLADKYLFTPAGLDDMAMSWLPERDVREVYGHIVDDDGEAKLADLQFSREHGRRLQEVAERWGRPMTDWRSSDLNAAHAVMRPHDHPRLAGRPLWRMNRPGSALMSSASSLRTTPGDYARFLTLMMKDDDAAPWRISERSRKTMLTTQTKPSDDGPKRPVGLGWSLEPRRGGVAYDHWGFNAGQHISMALGDTTSRKGIVIMTNGAQGNRFMDKVGPILTGIDYRSFF
ncbi:MAG: serine hydrolase domain-containing protein [Pseudomonadota bacterium]